jgi:hypothetical protein
LGGKSQEQFGGWRDSGLISVPVRDEDNLPDRLDESNQTTYGNSSPRYILQREPDHFLTNENTPEKRRRSSSHDPLRVSGGSSPPGDHRGCKRSISVDNHEKTRPSHSKFAEHLYPPTGQYLNQSFGIPTPQAEEGGIDLRVIPNTLTSILITTTWEAGYHKHRPWTEMSFHHDNVKFYKTNCNSWSKRHLINIESLRVFMGQVN